MKKAPFDHPFIQYLLGEVKNNRAARAALRRTLGRAPGEAPEAFRYVVPWLPNPCSERVEGVYYLTAGLFAYHPEHIPTGNMGDHLRDLAGTDKEAFERLEGRMTAVLRAHPDDLPDHLRRLVGILKAKGQPINWQQLMGDLLRWDDERGIAQKQWASAFWGNHKDHEETTTAASGETESTIETAEETE